MDFTLLKKKKYREREMPRSRKQLKYLKNNCVVALLCIFLVKFPLNEYSKTVQFLFCNHNSSPPPMFAWRWNSQTACSFISKGKRDEIRTHCSLSIPNLKTQIDFWRRNKSQKYGCSLTSLPLLQLCHTCDVSDGSDWFLRAKVCNMATSNQKH